MRQLKAVLLWKWIKLKRNNTGIGEVLAIALISRLAIILLAVLFIGFANSFKKISFLEAFSQWDGRWYLSIMQDGYHWQGPTIQANVAFFPFYPFLAKIINFIIGNDALSLFIISNLSFIFLCLVLFKLFSLETNKKLAIRSIFYLSIFPLSFVFSCLYTESLFLFLVVSSFYLARINKWFWASFFGFFSSLTRFNGIFVFPTLLYLYLKNKKKNKKSFFYLFLIPLGTLTYMIYLHFKVGDALAFYKVLKAWSIVTVFPWVLIREMIKILFFVPVNSYLFSITLFDFLVIFVFTVLFFLYVNKLPKYLSLYTFLIFSISLTKMWDPRAFYAAGSVSRYLLESFPIFLILANIGESFIIRYLYIFLSAILLGPLAISFFKGLWVF